MIDRDRVAVILGQSGGGYEALERLEAAGYRVVRAGLVPRLDALDESEQMLRQLANIADHIHNRSDIGRAADQIRALRNLALVVLGIDRDDVDEEGEGATS
jgi:NAD(P)-dependent dehydrogenase (short-subunit alcohol dehydrogenase family)